MLLLVSCPLSGESQRKISIEWAKTYGGSANDALFDLKFGVNGGLVLAGSTQSTDGDVTGYHGGGDMWVVSTDANGNLNWEKSLGSSGYDFARGITTLPGGYIVIGNAGAADGDVTTYRGGGSDIWLVNLSMTGSIVWQKTYGGGSTDYGSAVKPTLDGGYIIC